MSDTIQDSEKTGLVIRGFDLCLGTDGYGGRFSYLVSRATYPTEIGEFADMGRTRYTVGFRPHGRYIGIMSSYETREEAQAVAAAYGPARERFPVRWWREPSGKAVVYAEGLCGSLEFTPEEKERIVSFREGQIAAAPAPAPRRPGASRNP